MRAKGKHLAEAMKAEERVDSAMRRNSGVRRGKMPELQAREILNLEGNSEEPYDMKLVNEKFDKYFEINDPEHGGSFYLQSKIYRAKEALEYHNAFLKGMEDAKEEAKKPRPPGSSGKNTDA